MGKYTFLLFLFLAAAMTGCVYDDDISGSAECIEADEENLRIEFDWVNIRPQESNDSIPISIYNAEASPLAVVNANHYGRDLYLDAGTYEFIGQEPAENVSYDGRRVSIATITRADVMDPGPFGAGAVTDVVRGDVDFQIIKLPMRQQTRELVIEVYFTGEGLSFLETVDAEVAGIAVSRDVNNGFEPVDGTERPAAYENGTMDYHLASEDMIYFVGSHRLLGIDGDAKQTLYLTVGYDLETSSSISLDVTSDFDGFHTYNVAQPWVITLIVNLGVNLDLEIIDWYSGGDSELIAT